MKKLSILLLYLLSLATAPITNEIAKEAHQVVSEAVSGDSNSHEVVGFIQEAEAANRYANSTDVANYAASTNGRLKLNDYIFDTPFSTSGGYGQIYVTNAATLFSSLPAGGTIWLDAQSLPDLFSVYITNQDNSPVTWSNGSSKANPVKICPLGGQIKTVMTAASSTARLWLIADIEYLEINGFLDSYPGMKYNWSGALSGTFGFEFSGGTILSVNPFQIMVDGTATKYLCIRNVEISGGFCGLRIIPGNTDFTMDEVRFERLYIHDTLDGESFYVGQTTGTPYVKFDNVFVKDVLIARSSAEWAQFQHIFSSASTSYIENFVAWCSSTNWKDAFQQYQDNGLQLVPDEGRVVVRNGIIDGAGNSPVSLLSSPGGSIVSDPVVLKNILVNDGRDLGMYGGSTMSQGVKWEFRDMYFRASNNTYNELTEATASNHFISMNGTDKVSFVNITWDNSKTQLFESTAQADDIIGTTQDNAMVAPSYRKPGFPGRTAQQVEMYSEEYPSWSTRTGDKVDYSTNDIVIRPIVGIGIRYYNCTSGHTSSASTHPEDDATHWQLITWDSNGWPSYHGSWTSGGTQTYIPWDDYRLTSNSTWNIKGLGLRGNERNTDYTYFQWFIDDDGTDSGMKELSGEIDPKNFTRSTEDIGRYARLRCYFKAPGGTITQYWVNTWQLIN